MRTLVELPVAVGRHPQEAPLGWLLRTAIANDLSMPELLGLLGARGLRDVDVRRTGLWVSDEGEREMDGCGASGETLRYLGQLIWPPFLLRLKRPQICVRCIDESGFCHAVWEFSCFCVCTAHECRLVDRCARCGRGLRWFRPALDVCDCGAYLRDDGHGPPESEAVLFASEVLARSCSGASGRATVGDFSFLEAFPWWRSISLSGLMQIVLAFGVQTSSKPPSWGALHRTSTQGWAELVSRALKRLRLLGEATLESTTDLRGLVWEGALESIALRPTNASDRDAALSVLHLVFGPVAGARLRQQRVGRQLELFGGVQ